MHEHQSAAAQTSWPPVRLCGELMPHPGHVCAFFDSREEKYEVLAPYFSDGITLGDRIINVVDEDHRSDHLARLAAASVPVHEAIARDAMRVLTAEETYLKGDAQDLDGMIALLRDVLETAQRDGRRVRTCGEMNWIARSRIPAKHVLEYESIVNLFVPTFQCTLLCVYDLAHTPPDLFADVLATHSFAIVKGRLRSNPYFIPPGEYRRMMNQATFPFGRDSLT